MHVYIVRIFPQARQQAQLRHQMAADSKSDYSSFLQKYNQEQNEHYFTVIPNIFQVNIATSGFHYLLLNIIAIEICKQTHKSPVFPIN